MTKRIDTIDDLTPDARNANRGTVRGRAMIEASLRECGAGRSIVVDREGRVIGGNKTLEVVEELGLPVVVVPSDGKTLVVVQRTDLDLESDPRARRLAYLDNRTTDVDLEWDAEAIAADLEAGLELGDLFDADEMSAILEDAADALLDADRPSAEQARQTLAERFGVPPFSVLDARQGYWQERKRAWLALGIKSEMGRGENLQGLSGANDEYRYNKDEFLARIGRGPLAQPRRIKGHVPAAIGGHPLPLDRGATLGAIPPNERAILARSGSYAANGKGLARCYGQDLMKGENGNFSAEASKAFKSQGRQAALQSTGSSKVTTVKGLLGGSFPTIHPYDDYQQRDGQVSTTGTSIFDPVLCELIYRWFSPPDGAVLDPFAGGSVRGIVAGLLGRRYTGIDLRPEQVRANEAQAAEIMGEKPAPRWVTGDGLDAATLAAGEYDLVFTCPPYADLEIYSDDPRDLSNMDYAGFLDAYRRIVAASVGVLKPDRFAAVCVGDVRDKQGLYRNFVSDTIAAFQDAGARLYNEAILVTAVGSLPIRAGRQFSAGRKLGKTHRNVLVFVKGDPRKATAACGEVEVTVPLEGADEVGAAGDG